MSVEEKENFLRNKVKDIHFIDVTQENPLRDNNISRYDVIVTIGCLEASVQDFPSYKKCFHNITNLLNDGGYLIMSGILGGQNYQVKDCNYKCVYYQQDDIKRCVQEEGYDIIEFEEIKATPEEPTSKLCDYTGVFRLVAQRKPGLNSI